MLNYVGIQLLNSEAQRDPKVKDFVQTSTPIIDLVHVTSEHPTDNFQVGDLVACLICNESYLVHLPFVINLFQSGSIFS
jgi:hypothetical protein